MNFGPTFGRDDNNSTPLNLKELEKCALLQLDHVFMAPRDPITRPNTIKHIIDNSNHYTNILYTAIQTNTSQDISQLAPNDCEKISISDLTHCFILAATLGHNDCLIAMYHTFPNLDPNCRDDYSYTALMAAVCANQIDTIIILRQYFPTINTSMTSKDGYSALMHAVRLGHDQCIETLGKHFPEIDPNWCNKKVSTSALHVAIQFNQIKCINTLFETFSNIDSSIIDGNGHTAFMHAAVRSVTCINTCYKHFGSNININRIDKRHNSAIMLAISANNIDCVTILCQLFSNEIDIGIRNYSGRTAFDIADICGYVHCMKILYEYFPHLRQSSSSQQYLRYTALIGDSIALQNIHPTKLSNPNAQDGSGKTILMYAAILGYADYIRTLCTIFPQIDVEKMTNSEQDYDFSTHTALTYAVEYGHADCIIALHQCFPHLQLIPLPLLGNTNLPFQGYESQDKIYTRQHVYLPRYQYGNLQYCVPLFKAVIHGHSTCIIALHECFPSLHPNIYNKKGKPLLSFVNTPQVLQTLYDIFPDINPDIRNYSKQTTLMIFAQKQLNDCIITFAQNFPDCDYNMCDKYGENAISYAMRSGEETMLTLAYAFPQIDPNNKNSSGETLLMASWCDIPLLKRAFPHVDPYIYDKYGKTALMRGSLNQVRHLLTTFPDLDLCHKCQVYGRTALMYMVEAYIPCVGTLYEFLSFLNQLE